MTTSLEARGGQSPCFDDGCPEGYTIGWNCTEDLSQEEVERQARRILRSVPFERLVFALGCVTGKAGIKGQGPIFHRPVRQRWGWRIYRPRAEAVRR